MARHLNLDEQEQLAQLKNFWDEYGRTIILAVFIFIVATAGWFGLEFWKNKNAQNATLLYDEFVTALERNDKELVRKAATQLQSKYGSTSYAALTSLTAASYFHAYDDLDSASAMLVWAKDNAKDKGVSSLAVLRLADILTDQEKYTEALNVLNSKVPESFASYIADKRGNVFVAQGQKQEAMAAFKVAYQGAQEGQYKDYLAAKLNLLGESVAKKTSEVSAPQ